MGFMREAFKAGKKPDVIPTSDKIINETAMTLPDVCSKMSPS
jgi:hypothetical protein